MKRAQDGLHDISSSEDEEASDTKASKVTIDLEDSDDDDDIPSSQECDKLCKEFASTTKTDSALAMFYLQNSAWDLQKSLDKFAEENLHTLSSPENGEASNTKKSVPRNIIIELDDSDDDDDIPSSQECDNLCKEFASITNTNSALAMFYLQNSAWDLQRGLERYFTNPPDPGSILTSIPSGGKKEPVALSVNAIKSGDHRIRMISWNIDGLDSNNVCNRAHAVCDYILKENATIVFLQEVVPKSKDVVKNRLESVGYQCLFSDRATTTYFTGIVIKNTDVVVESCQVQPFHSSNMMRSLLVSEVQVRGVPTLLITTHLESTWKCQEERKKQLKIALDLVKKENTRCVLFGGDLNIRDHEIQAIGGLPQDVLDLWEATGKREIAKFTWDPRRNDNLGALKNYGANRFDRVYLKKNSQKGFKPLYFELIGLERITACQRYPSDHWGVLIHFDV